MKNVLLCAGLVLLLATTGSTCINDEIVVPVNVGPILASFPINSGPQTTFSGLITMRLDSLIDASYLGSIKGAQVYDIKVYVTGIYPSGTINTTTVAVNLKPLMTFSGSWAAFKTPQSLLGGSTLITTNAAGLNELISILTNGTPSTAFTLAAAGSVTPGPVPEGLKVNIELYMQINTDVN
jgi:hypothetical protein